MSETEANEKVTPTACYYCSKLIPPAKVGGAVSSELYTARSRGGKVVAWCRSCDLPMDG